MKGFIEIELQSIKRLIAINSIAGISESGQSCRISLNANLTDYQSLIDGTSSGVSTSMQFHTANGVDFAAVKKLIQDAQ